MKAGVRFLDGPRWREAAAWHGCMRCQNINKPMSAISACALISAERQRGRCWILDLQPRDGATGPICRTQALRYDPLAAERSAVCITHDFVAGSGRCSLTRDSRLRV